MKYLSLVILLSVFFVALGGATELPDRIAQWQPNVCRIKSTDSQGSSLGSGVYIGNGYVVTAHHVLRENHKSGMRGPVTVTFHKASSYTAKLSGWNAQSDIAFLKIDTPKEQNIKGVLLANEDPPTGSIVWKCGYGGNGQLVWHKGYVKSYSSSAATGSQVWFDLTPYSRQGDSGGPVFNDAGQFLGDLWGSADEINETSAVLPSAVKKSMGEKFWNEIRKYHVQCYGDGCYQQRGPFFFRPPSLGPRPTQPNIQQPAPGGIAAGDNPRIQPPKQDNLNPLRNKIAELQQQLESFRKRPVVPVPTPSPDPLPNIDLSGIQSQIDDLKNKPSLGPRDPIVTNKENVKAGSGIDWWNIAGWAGMIGLGASGIGIPVWAGYAIRGVMVARKLRRYSRTPETPPSIPRPAVSQIPTDERLYMPAGEKPSPTVETKTTHYVDAPANPTSHRIDTQIVNVESDNYQRAHEKARQQIARRYPGSQEILEAELSMTYQYLEGQASS